MKRLSMHLIKPIGRQRSPVFDSILTALEKAIETADEATLKELYPTIANISTHNAYHTGQIIYQRKLQGSWDPEKGVK